MVRLPARVRVTGHGRTVFLAHLATAELGNDAGRPHPAASTLGRAAVVTAAGPLWPGEAARGLAAEFDLGCESVPTHPAAVVVSAFRRILLLASARCKTRIFLLLDDVPLPDVCAALEELRVMNVTVVVAQPAAEAHAPGSEASAPPHALFETLALPPFGPAESEALARATLSTSAPPQLPLWEILSPEARDLFRTSGFTDPRRLAERLRAIKVRGAIMAPVFFFVFFFFFFFFFFFISPLSKKKT
jgi:hypothetical protein